MPKGVVAHGNKVEKFPINAPYDERQRALLALNSFWVQEVDRFHDVMDIGDAVFTPDQGSRAGWFGLIASDVFADYSCDHWIQRHCNWYPTRIELGPSARAVVPKTPGGTLFDVTRHKEPLYSSFVAQTAGNEHHRRG